MHEKSINEQVMNFKTLSNIYNKLRAVFFFCKKDETILDVNDVCESYLKQSRTDVKGIRLSELILDEDYEKYRNLFERSSAGEEYWEINFVKGDGQVVLLNCYSIAYEDLNVIVGRCIEPSTIKLQEELMVINNDISNLYRELEKKNRQLEEMNKILEKQGNEIKRRNAEISRQLEISKKVQEHFVKSGNLQLYDLNFKFDYAPAYDIGGDYFDVIDLKEGKIGVFISDVSGHGISASLVMAVVRTIFQKQYSNYSDPSRLLSKVNEEMYELFGEGGDDFDVIYCTAFYCVIDTNNMSIEFCSAGHPAAWICGDGQKKDMESKGFPLGLFNKVEYDNSVMKYDRDDKLVFFTDGFMELVLNCSFQNVDYNTLLNILKKSRISEHIENGNKIPDDISLIVVEVDKPKSGEKR